MKRFLVACMGLPMALAMAGCQRAAEEQAAAAPERAMAKAPSPAPVAANEPAAAQPPSPRATPSSPRDTISDSVITTRVKSAILSDPGMSGSDVSVNTDHGVVSLTGTIKSQDQLAIASAHAQRPDGVMRVDNQLAMNLH